MAPGLAFGGRGQGEDVAAHRRAARRQLDRGEAEAAAAAFADHHAVPAEQVDPVHRMAEPDLRRRAAAERRDVKGRALAVLAECAGAVEDMVADEAIVEVP